MITTNESDIQIFGEFIETQQLEEQIAIVICPYAIPFSQRWGNNGISADFIANYASKIFLDHPLAIGNVMWLKDIESSISFVANELLENATKYSHYSYKYPIKLRIAIEASAIRIIISNTITQIAAKRLKEYIHRLETSDAMEMYINQIESDNLEHFSNSSGLGLLTIINDYNGKIAWRLATKKIEVSSVVEVTTMVKIPVT